MNYHDYYHYLDQLIITIGLWDELDQKDLRSDQADHGGQDRPGEQGGSIQYSIFKILIIFHNTRESNSQWVQNILQKMNFNLASHCWVTFS